MQKMCKEKKWREIEWQGMYTVEASLIVPFLFLIILAFLYLGMFFLEKAYVIAKVNLYVENASQSIYSEGDIVTGKVDKASRYKKSIYESYVIDNKKWETTIKEQIEKSIKGKLLVFSDPQIVVAISLEMIDVKVKISSTPQIFSYFTNEHIKVAYEKKSSIFNGTEWVRRWQVIE